METKCAFRFVSTEDNNAGINARSWREADGQIGIAISPALMQQLRTKDELAFLVGHEMAHAVAGHHSAYGLRNLAGTFSIVRSGQPRMELEADAIAALITEKAGYNALAGVSVLMRLNASQTKPSESHPDLSDRIAVIMATHEAIQQGHSLTLD